MKGHPSLFSMMQQQPAMPFPPLSSVERGEQMARYDKYPVVVTDYFVDVFDMSSKDDRDRYSKLMKGLFAKVQASACTICRNELQAFDGNWKRYVEWFEYKRNDQSVENKEDGGRN